MVTVLADFAPKLGVLIQEAGRYSRGAGYRDERDRLPGVVEFGDRPAGAG
jgi:hypothetical protein